jgi:NADH dehydrogenase
VNRLIVIVGGGAGGLELAARLGRAFGARGRDRVLLVDRSIFHIWKPSLHEVAAGSLDSHREGLPYPRLARLNHFTFVLGAMVGLDADRRELIVSDPAEAGSAAPRRIPYESLVLATGSGSNLFATPGADRHALRLEDVADAEAFNHRITAAVLRAAYGGSGRVSVAIVGAGATGVELAAELTEGGEAFAADLGRDQAFALDITLVEAGPRILGALPERVSTKAVAALERRGVRVLAGAAVKGVDASGLDTSQGRLAADLVVWAAGVRAPDANAGLGLEVGRLNQFIADDRLRTSAPCVYALGDCAEVRDDTGRLIPARAQAAAQQAAYLARVLAKGGRAEPEPFRYRDRGSLISLGERRGVGALMGRLVGPGFLVEGLWARWAYALLHLDHHRVVVGLRRTLLLAAGRGLHRRVFGRLKLH